MTMVSGGREGDWKCSGCGNRNYAFRSLCNRCTQPRLLVDHETPPDSKWLPRIGDWICAGCSNNNYASRENCNKCGKPKASAALQAVSLSGAAIPSPIASYPASMPFESTSANVGMASSVPSNMSRNAKMPSYGSSMMDSIASALATGGWRPNDWICSCGFVNYASRTMCKWCNAPLPAFATTIVQTPTELPYPGCGIKRHSSDLESTEWSSKRQHMDVLNHLSLNQQTSYPVPMDGSFSNGGSSNLAMQLVPVGLNSLPSGLNVDSRATSISLGVQSIAYQPTLLGKGAKHWRVGDWMCSGCENHNFASRELCNRCGRNKVDSFAAVHVA